MHTKILAGAAAIALAFGAGSAIAQPAARAAVNPEHQATYDAWPTDQRTAFDAWPENQRRYFWTLTPEQQRIWLRLNEIQRTQIMGLNEADRAKVWSSVEAQVAGQPGAAPAAPATPATPATPADPGVEPATPATPASPAVTTVPGNAAPPPPEALNKKYPICRGAIQDSCQNPGEGGAPGRSRALKHWPGRPASEMKRQ